MPWILRTPLSGPRPYGRCQAFRPLWDTPRKISAIEISQSCRSAKMHWLRLEDEVGSRISRFKCKLASWQHHLSLSKLGDHHQNPLKWHVFMLVRNRLDFADSNFHASPYVLLYHAVYVGTFFHGLCFCRGQCNNGFLNGVCIVFQLPTGLHHSREAPNHQQNYCIDF